MPPAKDYSKGKIYQIVQDDVKTVYIGSTIQPLSVRMAGHRRDVIRKPTVKLFKLMGEVGVAHFKIELIADFPCERGEQLRAEEGRHIRLNNTVAEGANNNVAGRTRQETQKAYYDANVDRKKAYNAANAGAIAARCKAYYAANTDAIAANAKAYYEANADAIAAQKKEYREKNVAVLKARSKAYYAANAGEILAKVKAYTANNADAINARRKTYVENNRDAINARRREARKAARDAATVAEPVVA